MSQSVSLDTDIEVFVGNVQQDLVLVKHILYLVQLLHSQKHHLLELEISMSFIETLYRGQLLPPQNLGDRNYLIGGNLSLDTDSAVLNFGADSEITVTHVADTGLNIKHTLK